MERQDNLKYTLLQETPGVQTVEKNVTSIKEYWRRCNIPYIPARYVFMGVLIVGTFSNVLLLASLPISMTAMVRTNHSGSTNHNGSTNPVEQDVCPGGTVSNQSTTSNSTAVTGDYDWDEVTQSAVLTASTYGTLATCLIGGRVAELWSPKVIAIVSYAVSSVIHLLFPVTADWSVVAVIVFQVISGLLSGPMQPIMMILCAAWFPAQERQQFGALIFSAINLSTIISSIVTGNLVQAMGWRFVFYLFSAISTALTFAWWHFVYESPNTHPRISEEERIYINESTKKDESQSMAVLPWKEILLSVPVWAHIIMSLPSTWLSATLSNSQPTYMKNILHYDTAMIGNVSAISPLASWISMIMFGFLSQWIQRKQYLSRIVTYHFFNGVSTILPGILLICIPLVGCNDVAIIALLTMISVFSTAYIGGSQLNQMDLAINYTGTIVGLSTTIQGVVRAVAPLITGVLTNNKQTLTAWNTVFYVAAGVKLLPFFVFLFFGSVEEQPWNRAKQEGEDKTEQPLTADPEAQS